MCGIRLRLQLKEDKPEALKWFKITQISDQDIDYNSEFHEFSDIR
jgi:ABC-type proline/glycine betaine transport system substrate-binding protein